MKANKNEWVEIECMILSPMERASQVPEDTRKTPLMMWVKGFLVNDDGNLGDIVTIRTLTDRIQEGKLVSIQPRHIHDYGKPLIELLDIGAEIRNDLNSPGGSVNAQLI